MDGLGEGSEVAAHPALFNAVYCITNSPAERTGLYRTGTEAGIRVLCKGPLIRVFLNALVRWRPVTGRLRAKPKGYTIMQTCGRHLPGLPVSATVKAARAAVIKLYLTGTFTYENYGGTGLVSIQYYYISQAPLPGATSQ
jgi:hypothetical protein